METRRLGKTGHDSTIAIFGAAAFYETTLEKAHKAMEFVRQAGVNHIDVAPSYGMAEEMLGPLIKGIRDQFFLGCKTLERKEKDADAELHRSLKVLNASYFDLYQFHAVSSIGQVDQICMTDGALKAVVTAQKAGLIHYIGITTHGNDAPNVALEALQRFPFDTIMFPLNMVQYANPEYRQKSELLLQECKQRNVGVMVIKALGKQPWYEHEEHIYDTWYRPYDQPEAIQKAINFALSQEITGLCTSGDVKILPLFLKACEQFTPLRKEEQEQLISSVNCTDTIFVDH